MSASASEPPEQLLRQIDELGRKRDELHGLLERGEVDQHVFKAFRRRWNAWCQEALELREAANAASLNDTWRAATKVELRTALRYNLAEFHFPGEVNLDPPNGVEICFANPNGWRTIFYGAVLCENVKSDSKFYAAHCIFHDRLWVAWTTFHGPVSFTGSEFLAEVTFKDCNFMGPAVFLGATFRKNANFSSCIFAETAAFEFAKVQEVVRFHEVIYKSIANFKQTAFIGDGRNVVSVLFSNCSFENVQFDYVEIPIFGMLHLVSSNFDGTLSFWDAKIRGSLAIHRSTCGDALFLGTTPKLSKETEFHATGSVSLRHTHTKRLVMEGARFDRVPDFVGMHVDGPVDLDLVEIGEQPPEDVRKLPPREHAAELTARWRALKRLAEQARHHYYTALFARNETRARGPLDREQRPLAARLGQVYGALSDYGLSLARPVVWWFVSLFAFAMLYTAVSHAELRGIELVACLPGFGVSTPLAGTAEQVCSDATVASFFAQVPVAPRVFTPKGPFQSLFGEQLPGWVRVVATVQTLFSAVLLFLFLLAVRNHFRIR